MKRYLLALILVALLTIGFGQAALAASTPGDSAVADVSQPLVVSGDEYAWLSLDPSQGYGCGKVHIVQFGETLSGIAWQYGITIGELMRLNDLYNADFVYVGQRLCIPGGGGYHMPQPARYGNYTPAPGAYYHTVATGDTLDWICARYGIDQWQLIEANKLADPSFIWVGQQLVIPGYQPAPPPIVVPPPANFYPVQLPNPVSPCGCDIPGCSCPPPPKLIPLPNPVPPPPPAPSQCGCDRPKCECPEPPEIWIGPHAEYEPWGTPRAGLDACAMFPELGEFDDSKPIQRLTVPVYIRNTTDRFIPGEWAGRTFVEFYMEQEKVVRPACFWPINTPQDIDQYWKDGSIDTLELAQSIQFRARPALPVVAPGQTIVVTFFTHLALKNDMAFMRFKHPALVYERCFRLANNQEISCDDLPLQRVPPPPPPPPLLN